MQTWLGYQGCRLDPIRMKITDPNSGAVDVSTSVFVFRMVSLDLLTLVVDDEPVTIEDAVNGIVRYDPSALCVANYGAFWGWFVRTAGGKVARYPKSEDQDGRSLKIILARSH